MIKYLTAPKFFIAFIAGCLIIGKVEAQKITIAEGKKAKIEILIPASATVVEKFAAEELSTYLQKISGASFTIGSQKHTNISAIKLEVKAKSEKELYAIHVQNKEIVISGSSPSSVLIAVYDFLERLGCLWLAPNFELYEGKGEVIPYKPNLFYENDHKIIERPAFAYRKIDVDGGRTHDANSLKKMLEWMPKARYNTLRVPINLNGNSRVSWDKWRNELIPEIKKRGIILEIGGHGFQNFINAKMENNTLFKQHPDWFGKDSTCNNVPSDRLVFNTTNPDAVNYFINNIITYVKAHPEIDIFGLWPPDVGRWQDCAEMQALGTPADRQAKLANQVDSALKKLNPLLKTEIIAYSYTLSAPKKVRLNKDILVDYCPINQSFERQIFDQSSVNNAQYATELLNWEKEYKGQVGIYSYYRKYAWRSMPNVIPHYIQNDMKWYAGLSANGISTYAEPGDWFTYELNHYLLGQIAWNPNASIDNRIEKFYLIRYGHEALPVVKTLYQSLERISPVYGSVPFTSLKSPAQLALQINKVDAQLAALKKLCSTAKTPYSKNLSRLFLMGKYLKMDLNIQYMIAQKLPKEKIVTAIEALLSFLQANLDQGVFLLSGDNDLPRFTKKYGLTNQSLLD